MVGFETVPAKPCFDLRPSENGFLDGLCDLFSVFVKLPDFHIGRRGCRAGYSRFSVSPAFRRGQGGCFGFRFGRFFGQLAVELFGGF